eukprot:13272786-Alexandrium_andersonii.AAC.1
MPDSVHSEDDWIGRDQPPTQAGLQDSLPDGGLGALGALPRGGAGGARKTGRKRGQKLAADKERAP